jgi:DNA-binding HxlR family transcriptional regulator
MHAGSRALSIFTNALTARALRGHALGPLRSSELEETLGWAPQSSLRATVGKLCDMGVLTRAGQAGGSSGVTELTAAGCELLPVTDALEGWLRSAPEGPVSLDDAAARGIVRVLAAAWDSTIVRALAERPRTLLELNDEIAGLNYPALKRRLAKLRATHLVKPAGEGGPSAVAASEWLRRAVGPLALATRWERSHDAEAEPLSRVDAEALLLLALPLVQLPTRASGDCALAVLTSEDRTGLLSEVASVAIDAKRGVIVSWVSDAPSAHSTWALGATDAWLEAMIDGNYEALRVNGAQPALAESIVKALHASLLRA